MRAKCVQLLTMVDACDWILLKGMAKVLLMRDDNGDGLLRVGRRVHADIRDKVTRLVNGLKALERYVLSSHGRMSIVTTRGRDHNTDLSALELDEVLDAEEGTQIKIRF